eukprot:COSAG01_NODE_5470_length_4241_cov_3.935297_3_plen_34_part_00
MALLMLVMLSVALANCGLCSGEFRPRWHRVPLT